MALIDSIWWTRKCRIQTEKRLLSNAFQAQLVLVWYSAFAVFVSVYYLKFNTDSEYASVAWIVYSILVLVASVFINGLKFKENAALIKESYESLGRLINEIEQTNASINYNDKYQEILNACENHTDRDFHVAICIEYLSQLDPKNSLTKHPTCFIWTMFSLYYVWRLIYMVGFYSLPLLIFGYVESL